MLVADFEWKELYLKKCKYAASLERDRANLWGVNQELRDKINSLEQGQQAMLDAIEYDINGAGPTTGPIYHEAIRELLSSNPDFAQLSGPEFIARVRGRNIDNVRALK